MAISAAIALAKSLLRGFSGAISELSLVSKFSKKFRILQGIFFEIRQVF